MLTTPQKAGFSAQTGKRFFGFPPCSHSVEFGAECREILRPNHLRDAERPEFKTC